MKRNYETNSVKEILNSFFKQKQISQGVFNSKVGIAWKNTAGKQFSKYTKDIYLKKNTLYIKVSNPMLKEEISYSKNKIIELINSELKQDIIKKIVLYYKEKLLRVIAAFRRYVLDNNSFINLLFINSQLKLVLYLLQCD